MIPAFFAKKLRLYDGSPQRFPHELYSLTVHLLDKFAIYTAETMTTLANCNQFVRDVSGELI